MSMNYFEIKERLHDLESFRQLYLEYISFTNREENPAAMIVLEKLRALKLETVDSLRRVHLGAVVTRDAPVRGGKKIRINVIKAIFRDNVMKQYALDEREPLEFLSRGILKYRTLLWKQKLQLFNPVFWLHQMIAFTAELPLWTLSRAGYDVDEARRSPVMRIYLSVFQICSYALLAHWAGLLDWVDLDVLAFIISP